MNNSILIVGLGNPGDEYKNTRHNIGFMVIDRLIDDLKCQTVMTKEFEYASIDHKGQSLVLARTLGFMNNSGKGIKSLLNKLENKRYSILIIHDELAFGFGQFKIKHGGGHAGHNGVKDCIEQLGADFTRLRIGIGNSEVDRPAGILDYVLGNLSDNELKEVPSIISKASQIALHIAEHGAQKSMLIYNRR